MTATNDVLPEVPLSLLKVPGEAGLIPAEVAAAVRDAFAPAGGAVATVGSLGRSSVRTRAAMTAEAADLVIVGPDRAPGDVHLVSRLAKPGALVAVICPQTRRRNGRLLDAASGWVAAGRLAGLAYLQHVVALTAAPTTDDDLPPVAEHRPGHVDVVILRREVVSA